MSKNLPPEPALIAAIAEGLPRSRADLVEGRLDHLLAHAAIILFAFDRHGVVTLSEGRALKGLGYSPKELLGRSVFELYAGDPTSLANAHRVLGGEEFTVTSALGSVVLETTFTPIRDAAGAVDGAIGVSLDVTERVKIQERLVQAERIASMGTLAAAVAHEVNNPLTYVLGNLERVASRIEDLASGTPAVRELAQPVNQAREGADRVRRIVRGLQMFSRNDDDRAVPTDIHAVLDRALEMANNVIRHRARLVRRFGPVPPVLASELRLGQVFVNLLLNAAQAIPEGHAEENEIRLIASHDPKTNEVVVVVEDTGGGIPPEVRPRIFEPFFTTKAVGVGTGLGLSICHGIIEGFGGKIDVESVPGKGSTFRVRLPASRTARSRPASVPASPVPAPRRGRVLIVDDDERVARLLGTILGARHDVEVSSKPRAAADRVLSGTRFDAIFCDLMMPEMTGMEFYAAIAETVPEQAARIVFITGGAFTPAAQAFVGSVPNAFLEKPFNEDALHAVLATLLQR